jgi:hypothetical protein
MINLKALMVGFGFVLAILVFVLHRIRERSARKKKIVQMKNRRKKNRKNKRNT